MLLYIQFWIHTIDTKFRLMHSLQYRHATICPSSFHVFFAVDYSLIRHNHYPGYRQLKGSKEISVQRCTNTIASSWNITWVLYTSSENCKWTLRVVVALDCKALIFITISGLEYVQCVVVCWYSSVWTIDVPMPISSGKVLVMVFAVTNQQVLFLMLFHQSQIEQLLDLKG